MPIHTNTDCVIRAVCNTVLVKTLVPSTSLDKFQLQFRNGTGQGHPTALSKNSQCRSFRGTKKKLSCIGDSHTSVPRAIGQLLAHSVYQSGYFCHLFIYHTDSIRHARPDSEGKLSLVTLSVAENSQRF